MPPSTVRADRNIDRSGTDGNGGRRDDVVARSEFTVRPASGAAASPRPLPPKSGARAWSIILRNGAVDVVRAQDSGALFAVPCTG